MTGGNVGPSPDRPECTCKPSLIEQITELGVEEFYITVDLADGADDGSVRVLSIFPKPQK